MQQQQSLPVDLKKTFSLLKTVSSISCSLLLHVFSHEALLLSAAPVCIDIPVGPQPSVIRTENRSPSLTGVVRV